MTLLLNASTELMDIEEAHLRFAPRQQWPMRAIKAKGSLLAYRGAGHQRCMCTCFPGHTTRLLALAGIM